MWATAYSSGSRTSMSRPLKFPSRRVRSSVVVMDSMCSGVKSQVAEAVVSALETLWISGWSPQRRHCGSRLSLRRAERAVERVVTGEFSERDGADAEDQLDRLHRLQRADDAGKHAEAPRLPGRTGRCPAAACSAAGSGSMARRGAGRRLRPGLRSGGSRHRRAASSRKNAVSLVRKRVGKLSEPSTRTS